MLDFTSYRKIGLLGMNRRNADYILPNNPRRYYPLVDHKLKTKQILEQNYLPAPELYFSITKNSELKLLQNLKRLRDFVIKPARGAEGRGILVISGKNEKGWLKTSGELVTLEDLEYHVLHILAGLYSLGGTDDQAFVEFRIISHAGFKNVAYQGVPDIRVILYKGIPTMSMLRLPTKESDGKANLHQGAVGVGIEMLEGITVGGVHHNSFVDIHPDTQANIHGLKIPFWKDILETSAKIYDVFKLGYIGIDFVVDHILGPLILELNARPGLNIQLANRAGLLTRLNAVDGLLKNRTMQNWKERIEVSCEMLKAVA